MFDVHPRAGPPAAAPSRDLDLADGLTRELMPAVWALGVSCSALRLPTDLTRRERALLGAVEQGLGRIVRVLSAGHELVVAEREGAPPLDRGPARLAEICDDAVAQLEEAGIALALRRTHDGVGEGSWDAERLAHAVSHLLECAAAAAPPEAPEVRLHATDSGGDVRLVIERAMEPAGEEAGVDVEWGAELDGAREGGVGAALARSVIVGHGGTLARFAAGGTVAYVAVLPRRPPGELA